MQLQNLSILFHFYLVRLYHHFFTKRFDEGLAAARSDGDDDDVRPGLGSRLTAGGREKMI